jgi:RNA polymerase sigma factor (sigma-70 family)
MSEARGTRLNTTGAAIGSATKATDRTSSSDLSRRGSATGDTPRELSAAIAAETQTLLAAARLILLNEAEAWDVVQTTMEIALRRGASLRDSGALRAWLLVILVRQALLLKRRVRRALSLELVELELPSLPGPSVERVAVRDALAQLPVRIRSAVVLHHMVGLSIPEVAEAMHVSENTSKSQVRVGMSRLREVLRDE